MIVATYDYRDQQGELLYQVVRLELKAFRQRRPDGHGGWEWKLGNVRRVVYRLPELRGHDAVFVVEGEKDADRLWTLNLAATCNAGGAGKWRPEYTDQLRAAGVQRVTILPDADTPGRAHAQQVAASLHDAGLEVCVLELPDLPAHGDVTDWLSAGHSVKELRALAEAAPPFTPAPCPTTAGSLERLESLRAWLALPIKPVEFRIEGWQPRGSRVVLAAQFKTGKTTLIGNLLRSLVDGDSWLGRDRVTPVTGTVALLDLEMSGAQLVTWLRDQRIQHDDHIVLAPLRGRVSALDLLSAENRTAWATRLREARAEYLIIDCLRPALDGAGLDEHREAGRFLVALDALLVEAGITDCCVVHHFGHWAERARGDSRIRDWPDVEWRLVRQDADDQASDRFLSAYGRDVDMPETRLAYDPATRRLTIDGGSRRDTQVEAALDAVLEVLAASTTALSVRGIQSALADSEIPRDHVRAGIKLGIRTDHLVTERGPRGAILRRVRKRAGVCGDRAPHSANECAAASIEAAHSHAHQRSSSVRACEREHPAIEDLLTTFPGTMVSAVDALEEQSEGQA